MKRVFIGGCGRSGTTLIGSILGSHSECLATPESRFLMDAYRLSTRSDGGVDAAAAIAGLRSDWRFAVWGVHLGAELESELKESSSFADLADRLVSQYGRSVGKPQPSTWIDHTPGNVARAARLREIFTDARFIHLVRDGRAVATSVLPLDWGPNTSSVAARWWTSRVSLGLAAETLFGANMSLRVLYEDLVAAPDRTIRAVCEFIEVDFEPEMLTGSGFLVPSYTKAQHTLVGSQPDPSRAEAWRTELKSRDIEIFESIAGDLLTGLGYEPVYGIRARPRSQTERVRHLATEIVAARVINRIRHRRRIRRIKRSG